MADPGPGAEGETAGVPNPTPTDAVGLAWSGAVDREDGGDSPTGLRSEAHSEPAFEPAFEPADTHQSWRAAWGNAVLLLAAGLVLAGVIVMGGWALASHSESKQATAAVAPPTTSTTAAAPSSITSTPDQDSKYLQALQDRGIVFANPDAAVYNGKTVCQNIGQGMSVAQVVAAFRASSPAFSDNADHFVAISVRSYCPQNSNLLPAGS
ncbi:DUF732 domain-containing protein [Mycobacterium sp.]|uniref:DUF732 domain-containing protein n=1 Tax=Mycobacterium sp. TaxID=1785 RepID=UPI003C751CCA